MWRICSVCKKMGTHLHEDCFTSAKNKEKKAEWAKRRKAQDLKKENAPSRRRNRYKKQ